MSGLEWKFPHGPFDIYCLYPCSLPVHPVSWNPELFIRLDVHGSNIKYQAFVLELNRVKACEIRFWSSGNGKLLARAVMVNCV